MMKEWECDGARIVHGSGQDDWYWGNDHRDAEKTVRLANAIIRERNWLELVAMACNCESTFTLCPTSDREGWMLFSTGTRFDRMWHGTIADGHSHAAELAKALGLTEVGG